MAFDLVSGLGGGGGGITSLQTGSTIVSDTSGATTDITISSVDLSKAHVVISNRGGGYRAGYEYAVVHSGGSLTSSTNLRLYSPVRPRLFDNNTVYWQVVEMA